VSGRGVHTSGDAKALPLLTVEATAEAIVSEGIASEQEVAAALAALAASAEDPTTIFGRPRTIQVWARRL
jgi:hypothetical protein